MSLLIYSLNKKCCLLPSWCSGCGERQTITKSSPKWMWNHKEQKGCCKDTVRDIIESWRSGKSCLRVWSHSCRSFCFHSRVVRSENTILCVVVVTPHVFCWGYRLSARSLCKNKNASVKVRRGWGGGWACCSGKFRALHGLHPREMEKRSEVPRWQMEETRVLVRLETFLVGQEGAQAAKYQKEFSNAYSHLRGGRKLLFHSCPS